MYLLFYSLDAVQKPLLEFIRHRLRVCNLAQELLLLKALESVCKVILSSFDEIANTNEGSFELLLGGVRE